MTTATDEHEIAKLMTGWIHRDTGSWDRLENLFHPGAGIAVTWFSGLARDFVAASRRMGGSELRTKHVITAPLITFSASGRRAVTETNAIVVTENARLGLGSVTHNRFLDHVEHRDGRWGIAHRDSVYDFSSFTFPLGPPPAMDREAIARFPIEYAALAHILEASGFPVQGEFAVRGSDRERRLRQTAADWLDGGAHHDPV